MSTPRIGWLDVPADVRAAVEEFLGSPVVEAVSQEGGFSPGSADRVITADGRRAFVKIASAELNTHSVEIHRREAAMTAALPRRAHFPELIGVVDRTDWVAVVLADVDGRQPALPWSSADLAAVLDALAEVAHDPVADDFPGPSLQDETSALFRGWRDVHDVPAAVPSGLLEWLAPRLALLTDAAEAAIGDLAGDRLVHGDVRADNILIRPDGGVTLVDWPWATRGVGWFDALTLLVNVRLYDRAADVERVIAQHPVFAGMAPDAATRVLAGVTGFFLSASQQPPIPALPTLRQFQFDQGVASLRWLRERMARGATPSISSLTAR